MTISIWWLIGVSQITLGAIIACIFYAFSFRISKKQNSDLKSLLAQTIHDYNLFSSRFDHIESSQDSLSSSNVTDAPHQSYAYDHCLELYNQGLENLPHFNASSGVKDFDSTELQTVVELHLASLIMQEDSSTAQQDWQAFATSLQTELQTQTQTAKQATNIVLDVQQHWLEKKPEISRTFDEIVKIGQKAELSSQFNESLNKLYNDFIFVLNKIPNLEESEEDALLKMEAAAIPQDTDAAVPTDTAETQEDAENTQANTDLLEISFETAMPEPEQAPTEPSLDSASTNSDILLAEPTDSTLLDTKSSSEENDELSPETIMPISQYDLESDEEEDLLLDHPAQAIPDFDDEKSSQSHKTTQSSATTDLPIETELGLDDDIFDDLLSTMDEVIEKNENESKEGKQNSSA